MLPKKTVPGQQSFADVLKKTIEEKEKEKKEENEEEEEEEEEEEVIMLGDSTTSDGPSSESYVPSDSVSNPLGDSELVRDKGKGTSSWKMRSMKEEEEEEEEEKRKKKGVTGGEKRVMLSPGSADKKRAEHAKKQKEGGDDDDNDDDDDDDSEGDAPTKDLRMEMARAKSDVSKTPLKSVASARAVAPKAKTGKRTKSETMEPTTMMNVWNKNQVSALIDCLIRTLYLQFGTATGGDVDQAAIKKYRKSNRSLMPLVKVESLNNPLTRERIFQSNTAIEDKWKNVMKAVNKKTSHSKKILASKIFATPKEDFESITDDMQKFIECITMMNVFNCFPTTTALSEEAPLKTLFKGDEGSAWKSLAERAKAYDSKRSDDWWDRVHIAKKIYTILDQQYAGGLKLNTPGYNSEQQKSQKMATFVDAAVHEESQRENMVDVFSRAKKVVQRYEESANNKAELFNEAIALKKECMKYVFNVYEQKERNVEETRKELDRLVENPSADAGGSDSEDKSFDDWVDERAIELWQHWAFGGGENNENLEKNENLAAFFEHYVKMRERNRPSSDEE